MIDIGIITGSGIYELPVDYKIHRVQTRFGDAEVAVADLEGWMVGAISRHGTGHEMLPHQIPHRANLVALKKLGARGVLSTTAVGALRREVTLGAPILFDDLYFLENRLPGGEPCTIFTEPGEAGRAHLIQSQPYSPQLRKRVMEACGKLKIDGRDGGTYGHVNGPRFNTEAELRTLRDAGVVAVSQTCGPETVLAGELELPYCLIGFPVNHTPGAGVDEPEARIEQLFAEAKQALPALLLKTVGIVQEVDFALDHGWLYRVDGGV